MDDLDRPRTNDLLNRVMQAELAGVVRYTSYALIIVGPNRLPLVDFMKSQSGGLLGLYDLCLERGRAGAIYNAGGGPANRASVLEVLGELERQLGRPVPRTFADWRPGDQRVFYSDNQKATDELGWVPRTGVQAGMEQLFAWVTEHAPAIARARAA